MGSDRELEDPNPIIDEGNPTSTAGILAVVKLCDILNREVHLEDARAKYSRGWGPNSSDASCIVASWTLHMQDMDGKSVEINFDITNDESPVIIGMDLKRYSVTDNLSSPPQLTIKRPMDKEARRMETYMTVNEPLKARLRLLVVPVIRSSALIGEARKPAQMRPMTLAKRIHGMTHAHPAQAIRVCEDAGWLTPQLKEAINLVSDNCPSCALSGPPAPTKKISLSHVNEGFNVEIQSDFTYLTVREHVYTSIHIVDVGTGFSEIKIVDTRRADRLIEELDAIWICAHGAPEALSGDDEFNRAPIRSALQIRGIRFKPRPSRRHNKCGIIERKNGTIKRILERLVKADGVSNVNILLARACFLSNCMYGSKLMSAFELAKGYTPSVMGNPSKLIPHDVLEAHKQQTATRALNRLLRGRNVKRLRPEDLQLGDRIAYYYNTSKASEKPEWREGAVAKIHNEIVEVTTGKKGPNARIAYEDLRIMPRDKLAQDLMNGNVMTVDDGAEGESHGESYEKSEALMAYWDNNHGTEREECKNGNVRIDTPHGDLCASSDRKGEGNSSIQSGQHKDVGTYDPSQRDIAGERMKSNYMAILHDIKDKIGTGQVTASAIAFAPSWIIEKAMRAEHDENWTGAYEEVAEAGLPKTANIISSHVIFKIKTNDDESLKLKGRIVVHGNRDAEKDMVRSDCAAADMMIVRMMISLATILGFNMATADIKGAYMQSGPIQREVYVRPPKDCHRKRGMVWKLLKLPYGLTDAGRQWLLRAENWLLGDAGMERVDGVNQMFTRKHGDKIKLIVAKVIDDFLVVGNTADIKLFFRELGGEFDVGKTAIGGAFRFNGCEIDVRDDMIELSMWDYLDKLVPVKLSRARSKQKDEKATPAEESAYRALAGTLMYMGNSVVPQAAMTTSKMQQHLGDLRVKHITEGNVGMKDMIDLRPYIRYRRPVGMYNMKIVSVSDASHGGGDSVYGQTGSLCGLLIEASGDHRKLYHAIGWTSHKQKRVSYSAFGAEILAAADADDRGYDLKLSLGSILPKANLKHELFVDARALFDTITTLHEPREYRLRKTVARMRDAFESGELDGVTWIDGKSNMADALTKKNEALSGKLNRMLASGVWDIVLDHKWRI